MENVQARHDLSPHLSPFYKVARRRQGGRSLGSIRRAIRMASEAGMLPLWVWRRLPVETTFRCQRLASSDDYRMHS
jgi:hypothetical protein